MNYCDLHCDTATKAYLGRKRLTNRGLHINDGALTRFEKAVQTFAVFYDEERTDNGMDFFFRVKKWLMKNAAEISNLTPVLSCEGGNITGGSIDNLKILADNGVKFFGLVWNGEGFFATGAKKDQKAGLTASGRECIKELNRLGVIPDCSHLSDAGFFELSELCEVFVATHSDSRSVCGSERNLADAQLKLIFERGGLVGLNLNPPFLSESGKADINDAVRHADKMLSLGGESSVCLGCDLDGVDSLPDGFEDVSDISKLSAVFSKEFGAEASENIIYGNALAFFKSHGITQ